MALGQRPLTREQLLEPLVRGGEDGFVGVGRPNAVAPLDLVGVRVGLAGQNAGVGAHADHLVAQPAVVELVEQRLSLGDERPRLGRRLRGDGGRQLRRAVVGVDDPLDVAAELQAEPEVALNCACRHHLSVGRRATNTACSPKCGSATSTSASSSPASPMSRRQVASGNTPQTWWSCTIRSGRPGSRSATT
jgi:hypothetical protein